MSTLSPEVIHNYRSNTAKLLNVIDNAITALFWERKNSSKLASWAAQSDLCHHHLATLDQCIALEDMEYWEWGKIASTMSNLNAVISRGKDILTTHGVDLKSLSTALQ